MSELQFFLLTSHVNLYLLLPHMKLFLFLHIVTTKGRKCPCEKFRNYHMPCWPCHKILDMTFSQRAMSASPTFQRITSRLATTYFFHWTMSHIGHLHSYWPPPFNLIANNLKFENFWSQQYQASQKWNGHCSRLHGTIMQFM